METKKAPHANLEARRAGFFQLGLLIATGLCLAAFEYSTYDKLDKTVLGEKIDETTIDEVILDLKKPEPKPEKPIEKPKPLKMPVTNSNPNTGPATTTQVTVTNNTTTNTNITFGTNFNIPTDTTGPVIDEEFTIVEDWPYFPEFKDVKLDKEEEKEKMTISEKRKKLSEKKMYQIFGKHIVYPTVPRETGIEGTVHVSFRISKDGSIDDIRIARGRHPDLDKEAMRVVAKLPEMVPGFQRGNPVNVRYVVPIKFVLK